MSGNIDITNFSDKDDYCTEYSVIMTNLTYGDMATSYHRNLFYNVASDKWDKFHSIKPIDINQ